MCHYCKSGQNFETVVCLIVKQVHTGVHASDKTNTTSATFVYVSGIS
jgi:hypothetical protein